MPFPKAIITKPFLVTDSEYRDLGLNINLVGYDSFGKSIEGKKQHVSARLINWVEPYEISGVRKTLFYTEISSNLQVGDKVFIINGTYDNDSLIKKDKYKKGRDGYKVLKVDNCKIVLDIEYTGVAPFSEEPIDDYIKVYYISGRDGFMSASRQITTRGGRFGYKFGYGQNNIAFIDKNQEELRGWGQNSGIVDAPGFFVKDGKELWSDISDNLIYLGSFSVALSSEYKNNGKILIQNGDFEYKGTQFREGMSYRWEAGPTSSRWVPDVQYSTPIITKSNFRNGTFEGKFNSGLYGNPESKAVWSGKGTWNGGTILNSKWKSGTMNSGIYVSPLYRSSLDSSGYPIQKAYTNNNAGFGFNYVIDSDIESSYIVNGNFYNTKFAPSSSTFSVVESHILSITQSFSNKIVRAYFDLCRFESVQISGGELKNTRGVNSKFNNVKLVNSYFKESVIKDSTYIGDGVIKILGYDEWNMSEYLSAISGTFSTIRDVNQKIYKFYISKESFKRLKSEDSFYIRGLKVNDGTKKLLSFFDGKFRLTSWTEFYDDYSTDPKSLTGVDTYSFYKRGYECAAFLSTPEENSSIVNSTEYLFFSPATQTQPGVTYSRYSTDVAGANPNAGYSVDIIVSRQDIANKNTPMDSNSEWEALNPRNYNYDSDVAVGTGTSSLPAKLGNIIDISTAYIVDADFESGIIETSDWNSGHHINYNSEVVITPISSDGLYDLEIDRENNIIIANTLRNASYPENIGNRVLSVGDVVFLNSIDYDTRGMVTSIAILATGSSYSTTNPTEPATLVNTTISSTTMSSYGTNYSTATGLYTISSGRGTGLTVDIAARPIGAVLGITYSAPITNGGSYSMTLISSVAISGPIATSFSIPTPGSTNSTIVPPSYVTRIVTDTNGSVTGVVGATYSVFGPPLSPVASGATGVGVIFATGPSFIGGGMTVNYKTSANGSITEIYINESGKGYLPGQIFRVQGGNATFSITSVSQGEIVSYSVRNKGEDYRIGEVLQIQKPFNPNSPYMAGVTASITITGITASYIDTKGLSIDIFSGSGADEGRIVSATINNPGLYYKAGEIFTISGGNLDALVRIESTTGSVTRLGDSYKVVDANLGTIHLRELATQSIIPSLMEGGVFYTKDANNRWGYISKAKFDRAKIKSGLFRRSYITKSLIRDIRYDSTDKDFMNYDRVKNLLITDSLFSSNSNILSSATYLYCSIVGGTDLWNDGIAFKSALNGIKFSKGTVRQSIWLDGSFTGGTFYDSRSFDAKPTEVRPDYLSNRARSYFFTGAAGPSMSNSRYSWQRGTFSGGEFYKSDWESGTFQNGLFHYSKFYGGTINNGIIGTDKVAAEDTRIYNATINYATVNNAYVYANDTSYSGMSSSSIVWKNGVFNSGVFGSNNDDVIGTTYSNISYPALFTALPIKDYKITSYTQSVSVNDAILGDLEITAKINLKHTYIGDLIINLMAPNGKIINIKRRYSGGSSDNLIETTFTSDLTKPLLETSPSPHIGEFAFANALNQGVYYKLDGTLLANLEYQAGTRAIPQVIDYASFPPATTYEGDRYLVVATSSDPNWSASSPTTWNLYTDLVVEKKYDGTWLPFYGNKNGDMLYVKNRNEYLKYATVTTFTFGFRRRGYTTTSQWVKSYHSNTTNPTDLLNSNKTIKGIWTLIVMDVAGSDIGFIDDFTLGFKYKNNYVIKSFKNDAVWQNGTFNGGQFIDLGVWKNGTFNNGKFISTYGHSMSGNYLLPSSNQSEYSWQGGEFNNGEFGNESSAANSTWFNGTFNNGTFKGKLWNNGIFMYGDFKGGSSLPAIGGDIKGSSASEFVEQFRNGCYGVWRNGVVSDKKDEFVIDRKLFTAPKRAATPVVSKKAAFSNMLWLAGTFNHPSGEIKGSVWLDGLFKTGRFELSSFNPYVRRYADSEEFLKDDSCIWENGNLHESEFFFSKWTNGHFISGTAVGMIWKNGIASYMNANNVFWENGVWRNGNWNGSSFDYSGKVIDGFAKEILNRGIEWSGTNSCHIWNLFETDVDKTASISLSTLDDTFASDTPDSYPPTIGASFSYVNSIQQPTPSVTATYKIISDGGPNIIETGIAYSQGTPGITVVYSGNTATISGNSGTTKIAGPDISYMIINEMTHPNGLALSVTITGLTQPSYRAIAYAVNIEGKVYTNEVTLIGGTLNQVSINPIPNQTGELAGIAVQGYYSTNNIGYLAPTQKGIIYSSVNSNPVHVGANNNIMTDSSPGANINATILSASLQPLRTYYIRTWTLNSIGYAYSSTISVTTGVTDPALSNPVAIPAVTSPSYVAPRIASSITSTGGSSVLKRGFILWTGSTGQPAQTTSPNTLVPYVNTANAYSAGSYYRINSIDGATGSFTQSYGISGLLPNTPYNAVAFAYSEGIQGVFAWSPNSCSITTPILPPTVITGNPVLVVEQIAAKANGQVTNTGGVAAVTESGIIYTANPSSYPNPQSTVSNTQQSGKIAWPFDVEVLVPQPSYSTGFSGYPSGKTYYYKAYAINSNPANIVGLGDEKSFTTYAGITNLQITPGTQSLSVSATIQNTDSTISAQGLMWTSQTNTSALTWWPTGTIMGGYTYSVNRPAPPATSSTSNSISDVAGRSAGNTLLTPNTNYKVFAYVKNQAGTTYHFGNYSNGIKTLVYAQDTGTVFGIGINSATFSTIGVFGNGTDPVTSKGVMYSTQQSMSNQTAAQFTGLGSTDMSATTYIDVNGVRYRGGFTMSISSLSNSPIPGTTYYYRTYWTNSSGTSYGPTGSFSTPPNISGSLAVVGLLNFKQIKASSVSISNVSSKVYEYGIVWSTNTISVNTNPSTILSNKKSVSVSPSSAISGTRPDILTPQIMAGNYKARLYIIAESGQSSNPYIWYYSNETNISITNSAF